jgi:uncharacterized protein (UPF0332 family)
MGEIEKIDIAKELLESALYHYYESGSYFSAIHCAGAADEILGKYVEIYGGQSAFENDHYSLRRTSRVLKGQEPSKKSISKIMNYAKNTTKHMDGVLDTKVLGNPKTSAKNLLDRAIENYYFLMPHIELQETKNIKRFHLELVGITSY